MQRTLTDSEQEQTYLVFEYERRAYPVTSAFTIGRDAASNIVIREPSVSRMHAEVRPEGDRFVLHASGATGTRINGSAVGAPVQLDDGDRIEIGSAEFTFRRGKLPLGVSIVDAAEDATHNPDIMTRRQTITNPILGPTRTSQKKRRVLPMLLLFVVLLVVAGYYFLMM